MKIVARWEKPVAALGIGLLDLGLKFLDEKQGWKEPLKNSTDIVRLVALGTSFVLNHIDAETEVTEAMFYASLPLAIETLYRVVKSYAPKMFSKRTYTYEVPVISYTPSTTSTSETTPSQVSTLTSY